jgi:3-hydroxyisobutyrate dehydrogenase
MAMGIGFIGLGNIGAPMARQLLKLDEPVWVFDVAAERVAELVTAGARAAAAPQDLARHCRMVGLCVRDEADVNDLLHGGSGLLSSMGADSVIAVHSTVAQAAVLRWAHQARLRGIHLIDAPMTGGAAGAQAGTLTYMVGGDSMIVERCRPVFATSAQKIIHAGPTGAGILLKLCNNLMTYAAFAAIHEAEQLARAGGLSSELLFEVGRSNGVVTPQMEAFMGNRTRLAAAGAQALQRAFAPFAALGIKDLEAALASAAHFKLNLRATERVAAIIEPVFLNQPEQ